MIFCSLYYYTCSSTFSRILWIQPFFLITDLFSLYNSLTITDNFSLFLYCSVDVQGRDPRSHLNNKEFYLFFFRKFRRILNKRYKRKLPHQKHLSWMFVSPVLSISSSHFFLLQGLRIITTGYLHPVTLRDFSNGSSTRLVSGSAFWECPLLEKIWDLNLWDP